MADPAPSEELVREIKALIIDVARLEDMSPEEIDADAPLLIEGLGLDSIDVLELAMAIGKKYGVKTRADDAQNQQIFASVRNVARFVAAARASG